MIKLSLKQSVLKRGMLKDSYSQGALIKAVVVVI